jgi:hypothetical protein
LDLFDFEFYSCRGRPMYALKIIVANIIGQKIFDITLRAKDFSILP